ncbi:MAG: B12-binding domain-containing radical SAM protein [Methanoregulaceae archaeon]|nr:B12-binding domain-containing radical SAM protein [Methanoregulaceae archaeon]
MPPGQTMPGEEGKMCDIVLVNPPISTEERYGKMAKLGSVTPPLGICYVASFLERAGYTVSIVDGEVLNAGIDETVSQVLSKGSRIIGITSTITSFHNAIEVGRRLKRVQPDLVLILGGPYVSALMARSLEPSFDFGVFGEGEYTVLELMEYLTGKSKRDISSIRGLIYRDNSDLRINEPREYIQDLDGLPWPARHLLPPLHLYRPNSQCYRKLPATTMITSRGCPYNCIFCDHSVFGRKYRAFSAEYVVNEMQHLVEKYGIREIWIVDDTFTLNKKRVMDISDLIIGRGIKVSWSCLGRVNTVSPELLHKMKEAGCWMIAYGIETGNQEVMDFLRKGITIGEVRQAIAWTRDAGLLAKGYFMIGHPTDTLETIDETISFAKELQLDYALFTITSPLPNTDLFEICRTIGKVDYSDLSRFSAWNAVYEPPGLTKEQIEGKFREAYRSFYLRPGYIFSQLGHIKGLDDFIRHVSAFVSLLNL